MYRPACIVLISVGIRQVSSVFHSLSPSKRRPCLSSWLVVGPVSCLEAYPPLFSLYPSLVLIFSSQHFLSISITSSVPLSFPFLDDPSQFWSHFLSFLFLLRLCAFKLSSGVRRGWEKGECDFLLTARRERTKGTKGKGAGIASVYYSSPVLSRSV